jgi:hypothetical protein
MWFTDWIPATETIVSCRQDQERVVPSFYRRAHAGVGLQMQEGLGVGIGATGLSDLGIERPCLGHPDWQYKGIVLGGFGLSRGPAA